MTLDEVVAELKAKASESTRKTLAKHGAPESLLGVKVEEMKVIVKRVKKDHALALALYGTGIPDAMYLAGLIADDAKMSKADLKRWAKDAPWHMVGEYTVPWVAAGGKHGRELALEWIDARADHVVACGWSTLGSLVAITPDDALDLDELSRLLDRVASTIHAGPNRARYTMNGFVIAVGGYVAPLTDKALATAKAMGEVTVNMGDTACKVPDAASYIRKMVERGIKKKKTAKC